MTTKPLIPGELLDYQTAHFLAAASIPHDRKADHSSKEWKLFINGFDLAARLAGRLPSALSDTQMYRSGYGEGVRAAAKLAAASAPTLAEAICNLQSTGPVAGPALPAAAQPASIDTPEFRKLLRKIGDWHCGMTPDEVIAKVIKHVDQHVAAALPCAAPAPESQPAAVTSTSLPDIRDYLGHVVQTGEAITLSAESAAALFHAMTTGVPAMEAKSHE